MIITGTGLPILIDEDDRELLEQFTWSASQFKAKGNYYAITTVDGQSIYMHRLLLGLDLGDSLFGDHVNGCTLDNRKANLRAVTPKQNCWNLKRRRTNNTGYAGVVYHRQTSKYQARIYENGKRVSLGYYETAEQAAAAYTSQFNKIERNLFHVTA